LFCKKKLIVDEYLFVSFYLGATRGIGKGIALQLSQAGFKVYITGRTLAGPTLSLEKTANEVMAKSFFCYLIQFIII
jgi:NAD(P)-dependent dehydrogenase (short-subunit alcohol dehydrogenase family)